MRSLVGNPSDLLAAAVKATLMYATALVALRLGERRTLAQWTIIDFATAVAMGAIIGRTAIAKDQSYAIGAVAVVTLVAVHHAASKLRFHPLVGKLFDHRIRVLVDGGQVRRRELRKCALTDNDLFMQLRQRGIFSLAGVRYVLYETKGTITVVLDDRTADAADHELLDAGLDDAVDYPES